MKSKFVSILGFHCPRCRIGHLFYRPFSFSTAYKPRTHCEKCGENFEPEPGFYYGSMFISYILTGWLFILVGLVLVFILKWTLTQTLFSVAILMVIIHNPIFRFSRSLWIHFFVKYDPNKPSSSME